MKHYLRQSSANGVETWNKKIQLLNMLEMKGLRATRVEKYGNEVIKNTYIYCRLTNRLPTKPYNLKRHITTHWRVTIGLLGVSNKPTELM